MNQRALHPRSVFELIPEALDLAHEPLAVPADGAALHAWEFPAASADTVVVCGGNTGNKELYLPLARHLGERGYRVVIWDSRGFGRSTGEADLRSPPDDALAAAGEAPDEADADWISGLSLGRAAAAAKRAAALVDDPERREALLLRAADLELRELERSRALTRWGEAQRRVLPPAPRGSE